mmetsp:Transcript_17843/g.51333  ORF Transcript_17843/g.51333 Transcript_17843/m.51333 type:complete len:361 (-) Transcript_17843:7-1089(-)
MAAGARRHHHHRLALGVHEPSRHECLPPHVEAHAAPGTARQRALALLLVLALALLVLVVAEAAIVPVRATTARKEATTLARAVGVACGAHRRVQRTCGWPRRILDSPHDLGPVVVRLLVRVVLVLFVVWGAVQRAMHLQSCAQLPGVGQRRRGGHGVQVLELGGGGRRRRCGGCGRGRGLVDGQGAGEQTVGAREAFGEGRCGLRSRRHRHSVHAQLLEDGEPRRRGRRGQRGETPRCCASQRRDEVLETARSIDGRLLHGRGLCRLACRRHHWRANRLLLGAHNAQGGHGRRLLVVDDGGRGSAEERRPAWHDRVAGELEQLIGQRHRAPRHRHIALAVVFRRGRWRGLCSFAQRGTGA